MINHVRHRSSSSFFSRRERFQERVVFKPEFDDEHDEEAFANTSGNEIKSENKSSICKAEIKSTNYSALRAQQVCPQTTSATPKIPIKQGKMQTVHACVEKKLEDEKSKLKKIKV